MRVVAGDLRGRRIEAPPGDTTRPTTDKVREAVFNALGSMALLEGATVVDLFAGTGAMGIEAVSRGATRCTFVERDRRALECLRRNIAQLGISDRVEVVAGDALSSASREADIVIADPPYGYDSWTELLGHVMAPLVVAESGAPLTVPAGWEVLRERRYGRTHVAFLARTAPPGGTVEEQ
jgi:16S rRNA (guanine966-N2)-methyltransferase